MTRYIEPKLSDFQRGFQAGAASRDAEIARLKTVPMKYRRMEFNANLQDENVKLSKQLAAEQAKNVELRDFIARAQVSSGVCCCGDVMDGHASPMVCGHSPVDMWDHAVRKLLDAPSDTSSLEAIVKKAGEVMRERCASESCRSHGFPMSEIRALPAVTLEDLK